MCLLLKLSFAVFVLNIVKNSRADIPNCDYFDTVDISDVEKVNDTYRYNELEISANRTGVYEYIKLISGPIVPVKSHLRACVCELKTCARICCPRKNMLANGRCNNEGFNEDITLRMLNLTLPEAKTIYPTSGDLRWAPLSNLTDFLVLRDQFHMCDEVMSLKEDDYVMFKDGTLFDYNSGKLFSKEDYCVYPQFHLEFPNSIWIVRHKCVRLWPTAYLEISVISLIFYILTFLVYLYVRKLRNVLGKCLICSFFARSVIALLEILDKFNWLNHICSLTGYSSYFFKTAFSFWNSVISFHLWKLLTSMSREEPRYQFLKYSAFVFTTSAIPTGVIYIVNKVWEKDLHKWNQLPLVGYSECAVKAWDPSLRIYLNVPILILNLFNAIMFILTLIHIWKTKSELKKFQRDAVRTISCMTFDTETYLMFLRISVIMGVIWLLNIIYIFDIDNIILRPLVYVNYGFGTIVFTMLILKRNTLKLLMERIQGKR